MASERTVLITGSNRGIGLEFATQYASDGWRVLATCRAPEAARELLELQQRFPASVHVHALDVGEPAQIDALGALLKEERVDLLVNNAGWAERRATLEQATASYESWERSMRVNAFATMKMAQAFLEPVARSHKRTMVSIGSQMGSITENDTGTRYGYRVSKAAVNMVVRTLAIDLAARGIIVVSLHPGWVKTGLGGPAATLTPRESVLGLRGVIDRLTPVESGRFFAHDGREIPW
ncbi:SDR family oxidoreductase [Pyxidicoccus trucidator]|uniref:SDR family oxidoreductase n=1 Tax=Pyxidicoccus trucidator TaxID=2709662 RepID=UPI0013D8E62C|nr:SDR family oxidoreductase [Pyxidicoccus trucidator]